MKAVTAGGVVELDDDVASRWGPRVVDLLRAVATAAAKVKAAA
jgi:iron complex transport system substrate-binding protein